MGDHRDSVLRPVKGRGGVGGYNEDRPGVRSIKRSGFKCKKRGFKKRGTRLKPVSRKRLSQWTRRRQIKKDMMHLQMLNFGTTFCELAGVMQGRCGGELVLEHIESWRDQVKIDPERLQISCSAHNLAKGSKSLDGRNDRMKLAYKELAEKYRREGKL